MQHHVLNAENQYLNTLVYNRDMYRPVILLLLVLLFGCNQETSSPPSIDIDLSQLNSEAATIIESKLQRASSSADWKELGMYFHAQGLQSVAVEAYEYSLQLHPDPQTRYLLSNALAWLGKYDKAMEVAEEISGYAPAQWRQGYWQLDLGNTYLAEQYFQKAIEEDAFSVAAIIGLARTQLTNDEPERAIVTLESVINRGGKHSYIFYLLGTAHQRAGHSQIAEQLLLSSKSGQPQWKDPWLDEMRTYQRGFSASLNRAIAKIDANDLQAALLEFQLIETKYPYDPVVQSNLATVYLQLQNPTEAMQILGKALRRSPEYAPLHLTMAFALETVGEIGTAIEYAKKALELQPSMVAASTFIGKLAMQQQNWQLAYQYLLGSIELGDANPRTREMFAELLLRIGKTREAIDHYQTVLKNSPNRTGSIGGLVVGLSKIGDIEQANQILTSALQKYPQDQFLLQALRILEQVDAQP